jgi:tryptophanyl-tRNA synthetase
MYPVLMSADILLFNANKVPVGRDQVQHIEMARDFAQRFNHLFGGEYFVLPEAAIEDNVATLPGLDGRKMSKSYDNTIPLFASRAEMKKLIASIVTDSRAPGEAKQAEGSHVFQLYQAFASTEETAQMQVAFAEGIGWGDAKQKLFERIDAEVAPMREHYEALMAKPAEIEAILRDGAQRLRAKYATPFLAELRHAVGLRDLSHTPAAQGASTVKAALPLFKQYRDTDNRFYFKLLDGEGRLLVQSNGFDSPKDAGQLIGVLKRSERADAMETPEINVLAPVDEVLAALAQLREADA